MGPNTLTREARAHRTLLGETRRGILAKMEETNERKSRLQAELADVNAVLSLLHERGKGVEAKIEAVQQVLRLFDDDDEREEEPPPVAPVKAPARPLIRHPLDAPAKAKPAPKPGRETDMAKVLCERCGNRPVRTISSIPELTRYCRQCIEAAGAALSKRGLPRLPLSPEYLRTVPYKHGGSEKKRRSDEFFAKHVPTPSLSESELRTIQEAIASGEKEDDTLDAWAKTCGLDPRVLSRLLDGLTEAKSGETSVTPPAPDKLAPAKGSDAPPPTLPPRATIRDLAISALRGKPGRNWTAAEMVHVLHRKMPRDRRFIGSSAPSSVNTALTRASHEGECRKDTGVGGRGVTFRIIKKGVDRK